ncbi:MAG: DUF447 family protein [Desulfurococcales archaeon]|nr:DUF447 family protein [Desulfurococcales archaeon]
MWSFHEFIAFPCNTRYSTPLGLLGGPPWFYRVYEGARLRGMRYDCLVLLAPRDPLLFLESLDHDLEKRVDYEGGIPVPSREMGSWYSCNPSLAAKGVEYDLYYCNRLNPLLLAEYNGYVRGYGCFVELLVLYTKVLAGVAEPGEEVLEYLEGCIRRTTWSRELHEAARRVVQSLLEPLREARTG